MQVSLRSAAGSGSLPLRAAQSGVSPEQSFTDMLQGTHSAEAPTHSSTTKIKGDAQRGSDDAKKPAITTRQNQSMKPAVQPALPAATLSSVPIPIPMPMPMPLPVPLPVLPAEENPGGDDADINAGSSMTAASPADSTNSTPQDLPGGAVRLPSSELATAQAQQAGHAETLESPGLLSFPLLSAQASSENKVHAEKPSSAAPGKSMESTHAGMGTAKPDATISAPAPVSKMSDGSQSPISEATSAASQRALALAKQPHAAAQGTAPPTNPNAGTAVGSNPVSNMGIQAAYPTAQGSSTNTSQQDTRGGTDAVAAVKPKGRADLSGSTAAASAPVSTFSGALASTAVVGVRDGAISAAAIGGHASAQPGSADAAGAAGGARSGSLSARGETNAPSELPSVTNARLMQSLSRSEMQINVHSQEFGRVSIQTAYGREAISAQITLENSQLGSALSTHVPVMEQKLSQDHGLRASVTIDTQTRGDAGGSSRDTQTQSQSNRRSGSFPQSPSLLSSSPEPVPVASVAPAGFTRSQHSRLDIHI